MMFRVTDEGVKQALLADSSGAWFTTPHFDGYPAVLVRMDAVDEDTLRDALVDGWLACAPKALGRAYVEAEGQADR